jgi:hypothetical protein
MKKIRYFGLAIGAIVFLFSVAMLIWNGMDRTRADMDVKMHFPQWDSVDPAGWPALNQKKIVFAHMSVGLNIVEGVRAVLSDHSEITLLPSLITSDPAVMELPGLYHTQLGHNGQPLLKIKSFESILRAAQPFGIDIALMKLCYVDIEWNTDIDSVFGQYKKTIDELKTQMPGTTFLHCTVPLESEPVLRKIRIKESVKSLLGKPTVTDSNIRRMRYNEMIRQTWPTEQILDIAQIESVNQDGFLWCKVKKNQKIPFLYSQYTTDGGHLNALGSRRVGQQLLMLLANNAKIE